MKSLTSCGNCPFFKNERCDLLDEHTNRDDECNYVAAYEFMTPKRAVKVLHTYQKWRRGAKIKMPMPTVIGYAVDEAIRYLRKQIKENKL